MGLVYQARHARLGTPVAIKILSPERLDLDAELVQAFRNEVVALAALDHPNIARVFDHGVLPGAGPDGQPIGAPWFAMEYCSSTLGEQLSSVRTWPAVRKHLETLLGALAWAHASGVVHRDLKPSNILFSSASDLRPGMKLADFGIAVFDGASRSHHSFGTPTFMAPEQFDAQDGTFGPWTDIYAAGVLLWRLLTGVRPFAGRSMREVFLAKVRGDTVDFLPRIDVPPHLGDWLRCCLSPEPRARFQTVADALAGLDGLQGDGGGAIAEIPETWTRPLPPPPPAQMAGAGLSLVGLRRPVFVGREAARDTLWAQLTMADFGRAPRVWLAGEDGVGTSALGTWLAVTTRERTGVVVGTVAGLRGRAPGEAVRDLLDSVLSLQWGDPATRASRGRAALERMGLAQLEQACELALSDEPIDSDARHGAVLTVLRAITDVRTLMLFVDDVDQDPDLARFLAKTIHGDHALTRRTLLLATGGEPISPAWQVLELGDLPGRDLSLALQYLLPLDAQTSLKLLQLANGKPAIAVRALNHLARTGALDATPQGFVATASIERAAGDITPILDPLKPVDLACLARAVILGPDVDRALWRSACSGVVGDDSDAETVTRAAADEACDGIGTEALEQHWLREGTARPRRGGWVFADPGVHEALLQHFRGQMDWARHNIACARALTDDPLRIGQCWMEADRAPQAATVWLDALARLLDEHGPRTTLGLLRTAHAQVAGLHATPGLHGRLGNAESLCLRLLPDIPAARAAARHTWQVCRAQGWPLQAAQAAWNLGNSLHDEPEEARQALEAGLDVLDALEDAESAGEQVSRTGPLSERAYLRGVLHYRLHISTNLLGDGLAAVDHAEKAVSAFDHAVTLGHGPKADDYLHQARYRLALLRGEFEQALVHAERSVEWARSQQDQRLAGRINRVGEMRSLTGDLEGAEEALREAAELHRITGGQTAVADTLVNLMICVARQGRWDEVPDLGRATLQAKPTVHVRQACQLFLGIAEARAGRWTMAKRTLEPVFAWLEGPHGHEEDFVFALETLEETAKRQPDLAIRACKLAVAEREALESTRF